MSDSAKVREPSQRLHDPVARGFSGASVELVELDQDHPGFNDSVYRARRNAIADAAKGYVAGSPIPEIEYEANERDIWRVVWQRLQPLHTAKACAEFREGLEIFRFDPQEIPPFSAVNERLAPLEGFTLAPVAGLVEPLTFLQQLGCRRFLATQYIRHHSMPLYTPEPDVIHEYVGHVPALAHPELAELNAAFGAASERVQPGDPRVAALIRVYWFTLEFGVLAEGDDLKVYGAGILSSFGELERFHTAQLCPWNLPRMAETAFDPTMYQAKLFVAPPFAELRDQLLRWLDS
jgi:phenylalanine-4-hydroxylase